MCAFVCTHERERDGVCAERSGATRMRRTSPTHAATLPHNGNELVHQFSMSPKFSGGGRLARACVDGLVSAWRPRNRDSRTLARTHTCALVCVSCERVCFCVCCVCVCQRAFQLVWRGPIHADRTIVNLTLPANVAGKRFSECSVQRISV